VSVEGSPTQSIDFGTHGCTQVTFIGGELANGTLANQANAVGLQFIGTNIGNSSIANLTGVGASWTNYTPTITAASGTFSSVSATGRYYKLGTLVIFSIDIVITTVGSASVGAIATLPFTAAANINFAGGGREVAANGVGYIWNISTASPTTASIRQYNNGSGSPTFPVLGSGYEIVISGTYESSS
jgi:hypothetical protein